MSGLGVSIRFSREKNLSIILEKYKIQPDLTVKQIRFLLRFTWISHKKGLNYPECTCLGCHALNELSKVKT